MRLGPRAASDDGYNYRHFNLRDIYDPEDDGPALPGQAAPLFALADVEGNRVSLESLRGKPVVIEFGSAT